MLRRTCMLLGRQRRMRRMLRRTQALRPKHMLIICTSSRNRMPHQPPVCPRMLTYAHVCSRMLMYADIC